jgi:hypothetical protein
MLRPSFNLASTLAFTQPDSFRTKRDWESKKILLQGTFTGALLLQKLLPSKFLKYFFQSILYRMKHSRLQIIMKITQPPTILAIGM